MAGKNNKKEKPDAPKEIKTKKDQNTISLKDGSGDVPLLNIDPDQEVQKSIKNRTKGAKDLFVENLVDDEIQERQKVLGKGFEKYNELKEKLKNIKPDVEGSYDPVDDKKFPDTYSKSKFKEKRSALKEFENIKSAIEEAWNNNNFDRLKEIFNKNNKNND